jgi:hypothetical protein
MTFRLVWLNAKSELIQYQRSLGVLFDGDVEGGGVAGGG